MSTITREQLTGIIAAVDDLNEALEEDRKSGLINGKVVARWDFLNDHAAPPEVVKRLAEIALASLEAEPVGTFKKGPCGYHPSFHEDAVPLYTAPPAPVSVPTFDEWLEIRSNKPLGWVKDAMRESYDACRAAMLQGGNSPVIPDGWVMVPVEPTEDMIVEGFESEPDESFSDEKEWEAYEAMSGCQQAAHRAKLCWAAMIAAAPQQEV